MAKSKSKETSLPLIISLVFFVLTTIGLGVFCYVLYSDMEAKDKAVADAQKQLSDARALQKDAELTARALRVYFGVEKSDDLTTIKADVKEGDATFQELQRVVQAAKDKAKKQGADAVKAIEKENTQVKLPAIRFDEDLNFWDIKIDPKTSQLAQPTGNLLDVVVRSKIQRDLALQNATLARSGFDKGVESMAARGKEADDARKTFTDKAATLPDDFNKQIEALRADYDKKKKDYENDIGKVRAELTDTKDKLDKSGTKIKRLEDDIVQLNAQINNLAERIKPPDPLKYDQAQGKILRRLGENVVEIDLGFNDRVREGLTFSVLPSDYPEKGEQSRIKEIRVPDGRGGFRSEMVFMPKASIEVLEVLGPNLSKAKIVQGTEADSIRDAVMPGDLLYSTAWRKGNPEHIALIGIFDINGDGSDDLEQVVRDLRKMGVIVDAWYNPLKKNEDGSFGAWEGKITNQTRYVVKGYFPDPSPNDPNVAKMSELNTKLGKALDESKKTGAVTVNLKDFFPRMGYKIRMDVTDDQIRQAARKYLDPVAAPPPVVNNPNN